MASNMSSISIIPEIQKITFIVSAELADQTQPAHHMHSLHRTTANRLPIWWRSWKRPNKKSIQNSWKWLAAIAVAVAVSTVHQTEDMEASKREASVVAVAAAVVVAVAAAGAAAAAAVEQAERTITREISIVVIITHAKHSIEHHHTPRFSNFNDKILVKLFNFI